MRKLLKTLFPNWYAKRLKALADATIYEHWLDSERERNSDDDWIPLGARIDKMPSDSMSIEQLRNRSRWLANYQPHAAAALRVFVNFVSGNGFHVAPATDTPAFNVKAEQLWKQWARHNRLDERLREMVRRTFRDGECFIRRFVTSDGIALRFIDPESVAAPQDNTANYPHGIRFDPADSETPLEYFIRKADARGRVTAQRIDAADIIHVKYGVDANMARGIPLLTPVIERLKAYDNWMETLMTLHRVRSAVAIVKKYTNASPSQILAQAEAAATHTVTRSDGTATRRQQLKPGSIIHASAGVDYEMLSPNIQASDAGVLGRAILLSVAAGLGLSETMLSADSNNVNYASSVVAETPAFMEFREQQRVFCLETATIYRWVIESAIASGYFSGVMPNDPYAVDIQPSPMPTRDLPGHTQAWIGLMDRDVISKDYIRRQLGLQPDTVQRQSGTVSNGESPSGISPHAAEGTHRRYLQSATPATG